MPPVRPGRTHAAGAVSFGRIGVASGTGNSYRFSTEPWYRSEGHVMAISASEARTQLFPLIKKVNDDHAPIRITSKNGDAVLMSAEDYDSWQETIYLLRSPANAQRLMAAVARDKAGDPGLTRTMEELEDLAGEV